VTDIEYEAFTGTAWYDNQPDGLVYAGKVAYNYKGIMPENTTIDIQNGTLCIGRYAFSGCKGLISITIPNSVTSIGEWAFSGCSGLTSVTIPSSVTSIGDRTFYGCSGLTSVTIPNSVTSIGRFVFYDCSGLTSVNIGDSVTSIGSYVFYGCSGLTSVTIPNSVTSIGNGVFQFCSGLTYINTPNSVTSIGNEAFYGCSGLTSVTIGNNVTSIGEDAFAGCYGLTEVYCFAENAPEADGAFKYYLMGNVTLYVLIGSVDDYKTTEPWSHFGTIVALTEDEIDGIQEIKNESLTPALSKGEGDWYSLDGKKLGKPQSGIKIIRYSDGTTKKVLIK